MAQTPDDVRPPDTRIVELDATSSVEFAEQAGGRRERTVVDGWRERLEGKVPTGSLVGGALVVGLVAGHLLTQPPAAVAAAAPAATPSPSATIRDLPPPAVGVCKEYSREDEGAATEESDPVNCTEDHDAITVARIDEPGFDIHDIVGDHARNTRAMVTCQREAEHYLGIGPGVTFSRYASAVYEPNDTQQDEGQHWLRCDLVKFATWGDMMPVPGKPKGALSRGPGLADAYCVTPKAVAHGLPHAATMESPELGEGPGQAQCVGSHALVAVRRGHASSPAGAPAACTRESRHFRDLPLTALAPPEHFWNNEVMCVATITAYESWLAHGRPLGPA